MRNDKGNWLGGMNNGSGWLAVAGEGCKPLYCLNGGAGWVSKIWKCGTKKSDGYSIDSISRVVANSTAYSVAGELS